MNCMTYERKDWQFLNVMPSMTEEREKFVGKKLKKKEVKSVLHENVVLRLPSNDLFRATKQRQSEPRRQRRGVSEWVGE